MPRQHRFARFRVAASISGTPAANAPNPAIASRVVPDGGPVNGRVSGGPPATVVVTAFGAVVGVAIVVGTVTPGTVVVVASGAVVGGVVVVSGTVVVVSGTVVVVGSSGIVVVVVDDSPQVPPL